MHTSRRRFLKFSLLFPVIAAALSRWKPLFAAWPVNKFSESLFEQSLKQVLNGKPLVENPQVELDIPEIAENGALVPVTVSTNLPDIHTIWILVEKNPVPLALQFQLNSAIKPFVSARLKLAATGLVHAIAESNTAFYGNKKLVKVTIGGCGG